MARHALVRQGLALTLAATLVGCDKAGDEPGGPSTPTIADTAAPGSCSFSAAWLSPASVQHYEFDPIVVNPRIPDAVALKVRAPASVDAATLDLAAGGTVALTQQGTGLFCVMLTSAQVLFDYKADDARHNFVGFLNLTARGAPIARLNMFINVADETVPIVAPQRVRDDLQATGHLANILVSDRLPQNLDTQQVTRLFYQAYGDDYDFINLVSTPSYTANRFHFGVRNDVQGIGLPILNNTASYGSAGRLQGISRFPITTFFDMAEKSGIHELGHQWIAFLNIPSLRPGRPHWPPSTMARGIMGISLGGQGGQGGDFGFTVTPLGDGQYRLDATPPADSYNDMELYLMGLLPPESVAPQVVLEDRAPCAGCVFRGTPLTVQDVIAAHGPRVPAYPNAPSRFTMATLLVSMDRLLSPREMSFFEHMAARGEATTPVSFSSGFAKGTAKPFALATGGRGTLSLALGARRP